MNISVSCVCSYKMTYEHQDWTTVVLRTQQAVNLKDKKAIRAAQCNGGEIDTIHKIKSDAREYSDRARKLEADIHVSGTEAPPPPPALPTLNAAMRQAMIQARTSKKMSQQQLAHSVNTQAKIIQDLESGKVIQDKGVLQRINRTLGCTLRFGGN